MPTLSCPGNRSPDEKGLTIMELLLVVAIIATIAALIVPSYGFFKRRAQDAVCMENLRALHAALSSYMGDHGQVWPQYPDEDKNEGDDSRRAKWWVETLKPYGPTRRTWLCPADRANQPEESSVEAYDFSYVPTSFEDTPNIAYKWSQPWVIENGGFHDGGMANQVMPDGSLKKGEAPSPSK